MSLNSAEKYDKRISKGKCNLRSYIVVYRSMIYISETKIYTLLLSPSGYFSLFEINFTLPRFSFGLIALNSQLLLIRSPIHSEFFYLGARMRHVSYFTLDRRLLLSSSESTHESRKFMPVYEHDGNTYVDRGGKRHWNKWHRCPKRKAHNQRASAKICIKYHEISQSFYTTNITVCNRNYFAI